MSDREVTCKCWRTLFRIFRSFLVRDGSCYSIPIILTSCSRRGVGYTNDDELTVNLFLEINSHSE